MGILHVQTERSRNPAHVGEAGRRRWPHALFVAAHLALGVAPGCSTAGEAGTRQVALEAAPARAGKMVDVPASPSATAPGSARAARARIVTSQVEQMVRWLRRAGAHAADAERRQALHAILDGPSYRAMFRHYNRPSRPSHLPPDAYENMLLGLRTPDAKQAGSTSMSPRLARMQALYREALTDLPALEAHMAALEVALQEGLFQEARAAAEDWLPPAGKDFVVESLHVYLDGGSFPWVYDGRIGLDLLQLPVREGGELDLSSIRWLLAHELHHLGLARLWQRQGREAAPGSEDSKDTDGRRALAREVLKMFVSEGSAIKFVNNAPGVLASTLWPGQSRGFLDVMASDFASYRGELPQLFDAANRMLAGIADGTLGEAEATQEVKTFWMGQGRQSVGRYYFLGAELLGVIYDLGGKQALFDAMAEPLCVPWAYNELVERQPSDNPVPRFAAGVVKALCPPAWRAGA